MDEKKNDDWKIHLFWIVVIGLILFYGHHDHSAAVKQFAEVKEWAEIVQEDAGELQKAMASFDDENWRDVVPGIRKSANDLNIMAERLCIEVGTLEEVLTPPPDDESYDPY